MTVGEDRPDGFLRVERELQRLGHPHAPQFLSVAARTSQEAADALGVEVGQIANSLIFDAEGEPLLVLTSGAHRVDTAKVAASLGVAKLGRATPAFVREHTGQAIGGVAPDQEPRLATGSK